jgi:hypothetical protein
MPQQKDGGSVELAAAAAPVLLYGLRQALTPETPKKVGRGRRPTGRRPRRAFQKGGANVTLNNFVISDIEQEVIVKLIDNLTIEHERIGDLIQKNPNTINTEELETQQNSINVIIEMLKRMNIPEDVTTASSTAAGAWNMKPKNPKAKKGKGKMYGGEDMALERAMEQEAEMETTEVEGLSVQGNLLDGLGLTQDGGKAKKAKKPKAKKGGDDDLDQQQEQEGGKGKKKAKKAKKGGDDDLEQEGGKAKKAKKAKKGGDDDLEQDGGKGKKAKKPKAKKGGALQLYEEQLQQIAGLL